MQGSLATKLRVLRAQRGLTLRQAAAVVDVRPGTLSELERGLRHPHDVTLSRIAKGYDVPVEELLEEPALAGKAEAPEAGPLYSEDRDTPPTGPSRRVRISPAPPAPPEVPDEGRYRRERLLVGLMHTFVEQQGGELEELLKTAEGIPLHEADLYAQGCLALQISYEEMASKGRVSEELEEAKARLDALDARIEGLLGQVIAPGGPEQARALEAFRARRQAAVVTRGGDAGDEANAVSEADVS
jgi:transcriptional regulator with XRE-family HTH domain